MKNFFFLIIIALLVVLGVVYIKSSNTEHIDSFDSCVNAGYSVLESYPRQCRTPDGKSFVEKVSLDKSDLIVVSNVKSGDSIQSPLAITGKARGMWFFEASFPVRLLDASGKEIAFGIAQAQGDWMTENFVPFEALLQFATSVKGIGSLVFQKDNPSGLPEFDDSLIIPVSFGSQAVSICRVGGCSSQVCSDVDVVTTCEFKEEYICYKQARCERQASGSCGWTETNEFKTCMTNIISQ